ncbi:MAG: hypothetical protein AB2563_11510 [Candidatus Thiodiazotropha endolucinida]
MNEQVLQTISSDLSIIKWLFVSLVILLLSILIGIVAFIYMVSKEFSQSMAPKPNFHDKGRELLDKGELAELLELSKEKLKEYPDHDYANYFLACCYYRTGNIHKAYRAYKKLKELRPGWSQEFIDPYLKDLEIKIKKSKPEVIK